MTHNVFWKVSLNNGQTLYENKIIPENNLSPWQTLQKYLTANNCDITSLSLFTENGQTFNLPSSGRNPKFKAFDVAQKPIDFNFFHRVGTNIRIVNNVGMRDPVQDNFAVIEAIYPKYKLQIWVDNNNTRNSWVVVI